MLPQADTARVTARMEYRDTDKKDAHKQKAWRDAVHNFKEAQEALKTAREAYYGCGNVVCPVAAALLDIMWAGRDVP